MTHLFHTTYPRPRPATYDAGAGMDRKASLFGLLEAILVAFLRAVGFATENRPWAMPNSREYEETANAEERRATERSWQVRKTSDHAPNKYVT